MPKKRVWAFTLLGIVILSSALMYRFYFSNPKPFPSNKQVAGKINHALINANASVIQDTIAVDKKHKVVPFISEEGSYGLSYWEWKKNKWRIVSVNTGGSPHIWKVKNDDPSTYRLIWNLHPEDQLSYMKFYFVRDRSFFGHHGIETYDPKIQLEKKIPLQAKSYGVMKLPNDWIEIINSAIKMEAAKAPRTFFNFQPVPNQFYFGWIPYKVVNPSSSVGGGYTSGAAGIEFVRYLGTEEIEDPKE
ncbi:hypothetical protein [Bacillus salipaludis]|uniref:DUF3750 domain-containing protein n=1 Tax=Bacillus salipaludis TaxID=2547811 RepID=A0ABW8RGS7_9BACI